MRKLSLVNTRRNRKTKKSSADSRKKSGSSDAAMLDRYKNATDEFEKEMSEKVIPYKSNLSLDPVTDYHY